MADSVNRQVLLKSRPEGAPSLDNFELTQAPLPSPARVKCSCASSTFRLIPICAAA
jgi:hypothetical protein